MKIFDKINNKELILDTWNEFKTYISELENKEDVFVVESDDETIIYSTNNTIPGKELCKEDILTLEKMTKVGQTISDLIHHLDSSNEALGLFQNNMATQIYNPIHIDLDEFAAEWWNYIYKYADYMKNEIEKGDNRNGN